MQKHLKDTQNDRNGIKNNYNDLKNDPTAKHKHKDTVGQNRRLKMTTKIC